MVLRWFCLLIPGYGLSEPLDEPISLFSWICTGWETEMSWFLDMDRSDALEDPIYWILMISGLPDTWFWWFWKLLDDWDDPISLLQRWFSDDFASWIALICRVLPHILAFPRFWDDFDEYFDDFQTILMIFGWFYDDFRMFFVNILRNLRIFEAFLIRFCLVIALICLDFPPVCIPVCRRYRYKEDDTGATYVHGATGCIHMTHKPHDPHTRIDTPWSTPGPPVTPSGRPTFPSGQNTVSNPKAPDLSLGDLSTQISWFFMIFDDFWTLRDSFWWFRVLLACLDFLIP